MVPRGCGHAIDCLHNRSRLPIRRNGTASYENRGYPDCHVLGSHSCKRSDTSDSVDATADARSDRRNTGVSSTPGRNETDRLSILQLSVKLRTIRQMIPAIIAPALASLASRSLTVRNIDGGSSQWPGVFRRPANLIRRGAREGSESNLPQQQH